MHELLLATAGLVVALAFFTLLGFVVWVLRAAPRLPGVIIAIGSVLSSLAGVIAAINWFA